MNLCSRERNPGFESGSGAPKPARSVVVGRWMRSGKAFVAQPAASPPSCASIRNCQAPLRSTGRAAAVPATTTARSSRVNLAIMLWMPLLLVCVGGVCLTQLGEGECKQRVGCRSHAAPGTGPKDAASQALPAWQGTADRLTPISLSFILFTLALRQPSPS